MNINKKLDRVKQWAGEKMGAESKTNVSEEFKALEMEMALRHDGTSFIMICGVRTDVCRYGEITEVYDGLRQVPIEAERDRRQGEDPTGCILGPDDDTSWRGL
jgi:hypothetical protein